MNEHGSIENQVLDTIEMIASSIVEGAGYDRTISATIISCVDTALGKYKIRYQDAIYYATTSDINKTFSDGASVYVLVPGNDFSKEKKIIGTTGDLKNAYDSSLEENPYLIVGNNCGELNNVIEFSSYSKEKSFLLYSKDNIEEENILKIDEKSLLDYIKDSDRIRIGMDFRTIIANDQYNGTFGIEVVFLEKNIENKESPNLKTLILSNYDMIGYPYCSVDWISQSKDFPIEKDKFLGIKEVRFFLKGFEENEDLEYIKDIAIKNFIIAGLAHQDSAVLNTYHLRIYQPYGDTFSENSSKTSLELKAEVRLKNQPVRSSTPIEYYWFKENPEVQSTERPTQNSIPKYHPWGGEGWECLNSYNRKVTDLTTGKPAMGEIPDENALVTINWNSQESYYVKKEFLKIDAVRIKCVAVYNNGQGVTKPEEVVIKNLEAPFSMEITSSDDNFIFYDSIGSKTLSLKAIDKKTGEQLTQDKYRFYWGYITDSKSYQDITSDSKSPNLIINGRDIYLEKRIFATLKEVIDIKDGKEIEELIGTVSVTIKNERTPKENKPYINIENGEQVFIYDEAGLAPNHISKNPGQLINPLTFSLYDANGTKINVEENFDAEIAWFLPRENTLLKDIRIKEEDSPPDIIDGKYTKIVVSGENPYLNLPFGIEQQYSLEKINNNIKLEIKYNNQVLQAFTNFTFIKEGRAGTNGTDTFGRIVLNAEEGKGFHGRYPTLIFNTNGDKKVWINGGENNSLMDLSTINDFPFRAELWTNGREINPSSVKWRLKRNLANNSISYLKGEDIEKEIFSFEENPYIYNDSMIENGYVIIPGEDSYKKRTVHTLLEAKIYYAEEDTSTSRMICATLPLSIAMMQKDNLYIQMKPGTGFNEVVYSNDGTNPKIPNNSFFEIEVLKTDGTPAEGDFTYSWKRVNLSSQKYLSFKARELDDNNLKETEEQSFNNKNYKPADKVFDGFDLDIALYCEVKQGEELIGTLHFPIHFLLNQYGHAALNDWDGNSIAFKNEAGEENYILAPQIGAGVKDREKNTFTGMVMGVVKTHGIGGSQTVKNGLVGYKDSIQSIFLDAKTGKAEFGIPGEGQIVIKPETNGSKYEALIEGGQYVDKEESGEGMQINLTEPSIKWGNRKFIIDKNGILNAVDVKLSGKITAGSGSSFGKWTVSDNAIYRGSDQHGATNGMYFGEEGLSITKKFIVDKDGNLNAEGTLTAKAGSKIGPWYISGDSISRNSGGTAASDYGALGTGNMYFGTSGLSISNVFKVSNTGHLEASSVNIGNGKLTFDTNGLTVSGTITGSTITGSGITCGDYFSVSDTGYLQASSGKIGNFKLTSSGFSTDTDRVEIFSEGRFRMVSPATYTDGDLVWYPSIDMTGGFLNLQGRSASNLTTNPNDKYGTVSIDNRGITMKKSDKGEAWLWISNDQKLFDCNFKNTGYIIAGTRIYLNNGYGLRGMKIDETTASINGSNLIAMIDQADNVQIGSTDNSGDTEIVSPLDIYLRCSSGTAYIKGNLDISGSIKASNLSNHTNNSATTQSPNLRVRTNGEIVQIKDGSSKYIKNNIQKIQQEEINPNNLYNLSVYEFKYNKDQLHKNDCRYNKFIPGFIIEELNEIYPIAIDKNESEESINWGWNERYLIPPMLKLIQDQKQNIDKLEETIKKQQEQIDLLMTKLN